MKKLRNYDHELYSTHCAKRIVTYTNSPLDSLLLYDNKEDKNYWIVHVLREWRQDWVWQLLMLYLVTCTSFFGRVFVLFWQSVSVFLPHRWTTSPKCLYASRLEIYSWEQSDIRISISNGVAPNHNIQLRVLQVGGEGFIRVNDRVRRNVLAVSLPQRAQLRPHVAPLVVRVFVTRRHLHHRVDVDVDVRGRVRWVEDLAEGQVKAACWVLGVKKGKTLIKDLTTPLVIFCIYFSSMCYYLKK